MTHSHLFEPITIGRTVLRNRVVFAAHLTNFADGGRPTARHAAYYAARAKGGAGLIISEEQIVHRFDRPYEKLIEAYRPEVIDGYRRITDAVHDRGGVMLAQLNHNGGQSSGMYTGRAVVGPSPVADPLFREVPVAVDRAGMDEIVEAYALVAEHCRRGGFDGVELQCSQSSVLRGFLSRATNTRSDEYGGALEARARLLLEVIAAVRAALGPDPILGVRLGGAEQITGGIVLSEAVQTAVLVEATGAVDFINTTIGVVGSTLHLVEASMAVPSGYANFVPSAIRRHVRVPVIGVGRFTDPSTADRAIAEGHCDLVGVVRGQIADPEFANKAQRGVPVRTCLSCNQDCIGRVGMNSALACVVNPDVGLEFLGAPTVRPKSMNVIVVGAGPAGLQAAATAAAEGHRVTVLERWETVGGQIRTAARAPYRQGLLDAVTDLEVQCRSLGVDIRTGIEACAETVLDYRPEAVVLAIGAEPVRPDWAGSCDRVRDVREVLDSRVVPFGEVLVFDELGFHQATSTAEFLAESGCAVTIATPAMVVGQDLGLTLDLPGWRRRAHAAGITCVTDVVPVDLTVEGASGPSISLLHHQSGTVTRHRFDWIVCSLHQCPSVGDWSALADVPVVRIGDALSPRRLDAAVREGSQVTNQLGVRRRRRSDRHEPSSQQPALH